MSLIATPYSITELGESEERHEIGVFMDHEGFDCRGYHGEVLIEGTWYTVWQFGSTGEAERFARGWGGVLFDEATQAKVTERRALEQVYQPDKSRPSMAERRCNYSDVLFANASG